MQHSVHTISSHHILFSIVIMGNEQSTRAFEPKKVSTISSNADAKPIKSAMRRTSSVSEDASSLESNNGKRYLPKGLGGGHSGLVMPTKPGDMAAGGPAGGVGYHSPEWGWYINTTPPTPEMYHSQYSSTRGKLPSSKDGVQAPGQSCGVPMTGPPAAFTAPAKTAAMGWPSVPL